MVSQMPYDRKGVYKEMIEVRMAGASGVWEEWCEILKASHRFNCARFCRSWQEVWILLLEHRIVRFRIVKNRALGL